MSKREEILSKSLELFLKKGYERTSLNEIADLVGVTKPAIYYHFDDKQALYEEVCRKVLKMAEPEWSSTEPPATFKDTLQDTFRSMMKTLQRFHDHVGTDDPVAIFRYYSFVYEAIIRVPWFRESIGDFYAANISKIAHLMANNQDSGDIRNDLDARVVSIAIAALIEGSFLMHITSPEIDLDTLIGELVDNLWTMLSP